QAYVNAMNAAGDWLSDSLGAARDQWRWGRIHTVSLRADFFSSAGNTSYDSTPYCAQGGLFTVNVANPNDAQDHDYRFGSGPSMRFSCEANAANPVRCAIDLPGGERHLHQDPHDLDLMTQHWLTGTRIPLHFLANEVAAAAQSTDVLRAP
ncbi:MAG: penicillin acylase family protein, partial [Myxococcota bacterium]